MLDARLLEELQEYVALYTMRFSRKIMRKMIQAPIIAESEILESRIEMEDFIKENLKPSFQQVLFTFIDESGATDPEIYRKAGLDRKHFSKIRSNPDYRPKKETVMALALALELDREETDELLGAAGYYLSPSNTYDLVLQFCLERKIYNLDEVNEALGHFSLRPLVG